MLWVHNRRSFRHFKDGWENFVILDNFYMPTKIEANIVWMNRVQLTANSESKPQL
jgi:hypothetical protein